MKNTQVIQLMSIVRLSIFMLGITMMSCNSKKQQQGNREACDANRKKVFRVFVENARKREGNKLQLAKTSRKKPA